MTEEKRNNPKVVPSVFSSLNLLKTDFCFQGVPEVLMKGAGGSLLDVIYFFHPDHLGSSTIITDGSGYAYQIFLNLPFGAVNPPKNPTV